MYASRFVDSVIDTCVPYALAATIVEPSVTGSAHALARRPTFVPRVALCHERNGTVYRHYVRFQRVHLFFGSLDMIFHLFLGFRCEQGYVEVYRKRECEPPFVRIRFRGQRLEQTWDRFAEIFHVRFLAQRIVRDVWFRAEIYARAALVVEITETREAFLATGTGNEVALAALREHTLAHDAGANRLVAGFRISRYHRRDQDSNNSDQRTAPTRHRVLAALLRRVPRSEQRVESGNLCAGNYFKHAQPVRVATATKHILSANRGILFVVEAKFSRRNSKSLIRPRRSTHFVALSHLVGHTFSSSYPDDFWDRFLGFKADESRETERRGTAMMTAREKNQIRRSIAEGRR